MPQRNPQTDNTKQQALSHGDHRQSPVTLVPTIPDPSMRESDYPID